MSVKINTIHFLLRQIYRVMVIWPYEAAVFLVFGISDLFSKKEQTGTGVYFLITSVIFFSEKRLSYSGTRSVYSPADRMNQTLETIRSIRKAVPEAKILLVEAGRKEDLPEIKSAVDKYIYLGDKKCVRRAVDSPFKSLGETVMLWFGRKIIPPSAGQIFKISGRYILNSDFDPSLWLTDKFKFYFIRPDFVSTRLYSFSGAAAEVWQRALIKSFPYLLLDYPVEFLLPKWIPAGLQEKVLSAGVSGSDATNGQNIKE